MSSCRFWLFVFMCAVSFHISHATLKLDINPTYIELDLTASLYVNCTFTYASPSVISNLISIVITKMDDSANETSHELISINTFHPNVPNVDPLLQANAQGQIDDSGVSYVSLFWTYPTTKEAGSYRCTANGLDSTGHSRDVSLITRVTASTPNIDQLIQAVKDQQGELREVEKTLSDVAKALSDIEKWFEATSDFYKPGQYNGHSYLLSKFEADVNRSQERCEQVGGYLVEINDANENNFIKAFLDEISPNVILVLTGGTNEINNSRWQWRRSQLNVSFTDWTPGEPRSPATFHCLVLNRNIVWRWYNWPCYSQRNFLCEL